MFHIIMTREEKIYIPPISSRIFTGHFGQKQYYENWIVKSFNTRKEAEEALKNIDEWFYINGIKRGWFDTSNVYCLTGIGKSTHVHKENRHIIYEAFIDDNFISIIR